MKLRTTLVDVDTSKHVRHTFMIMRRGRTGFRAEARGAGAGASSSPKDSSELRPMPPNESHTLVGACILLVDSLSKETTGGGDDVNVGPEA